MQKKGKWYMAGTEGSGDYFVLARTELGRVGIRPLVNGKYRIRVEPFKNGLKGITNLTREARWKQPQDQGQNRFSIEAKDDQEMSEHRLQALKAIGATREEHLNLRLRRLERMTKPELVELAEAFFTGLDAEQTKAEIARLLIPEGLLSA